MFIVYIRDSSDIFVYFNYIQLIVLNVVIFQLSIKWLHSDQFHFTKTSRMCIYYRYCDPLFCCSDELGLSRGVEKFVGLKKKTKLIFFIFQCDHRKCHQTS